MDGWFRQALFLALLVADLVLVGVFLRTLATHPAPPFGRFSLRRRARAILGPASPIIRFKRESRERLGRLGWMRFLAYSGVLGGLVLLPWDFKWGPLDSETQSEELLRTLWQVVAAALGVSVAMVAFAFQAFSSSGQRAYGGSLREFAQQSRLLLAIEVGILSLLLDGVVLFGWGHNAPRGLPAAWAIGLSAVTLVGVGYVMHRVVRLLDDRSLREMRATRVRRLVVAAMRHQLIGQAGDAWLHASGFPVRRAALAPPGAIVLHGRSTGEVTDVRLGRLARFVVSNPGTEISLAVGLGSGVNPQTALMYLTGTGLTRRARRLPSAVRVRASGDDPPDAALNEALERLHQQAMDAARNGQELEWRAISESYELVLLALPRAAAQWGVPFAGAVMAPGFFGHGPVQRIAQHLYDELVAAVSSNSRELVGPITYFPQHVAVEAARLGAPAVARPLFALYPAMYLVARRGS